MAAATYSHDAKSLLISATGPSAANALITDSLQISRDSRRRITRIQHNSQSTNRIYDHWNMIAEYAPNGTLLSEYLHGPRIDEILCATSGSATTYHHHDGLGSVIFLTNAGGSVVERYRYDVFGTVQIFDSSFNPLPSSLQNNRLLFTGRELLANWNSTTTATAPTAPC